MQLIEEMGIKALEIPMHPRTGMDLDALEVALKTGGIKAIFGMPTVSNPLGSVMPDENKRRLMSLLERLEVPAAKSLASTRVTVRPRDAASRAAPAPTTPPPMTNTSISLSPRVVYDGRALSRHRDHPGQSC